MIKIFLAEDQQLFVEGLKQLLADQEDIAFEGTANNGREALTAILESVPDLCMLDINMPDMDGISLAIRLKKEHPQLPIIMLSTHTNKEFIKDLVSIGVEGFVIKNADKEELVQAIRKVASGGQWFSDILQPEVAETRKEIENHPDHLKLLSKRELEILRLIGQGFSSVEIAEKLFLSAHTVDTHRRNIMLKLNMNNLAALVRYANDRGLTL